MRVSLVSTAVAFPALDALDSLTSLLLRRGDRVQRFTPHANTPSAMLSDQTFRTSDLFIYHAVEADPLLDTLLALDRGVVILWLQPKRNAHYAEVHGNLVRLAAASDLIILDDEAMSDELVRAGVVDQDRIHIVPPPVSLSHFSPGPPEPEQLRATGLVGKRVLLAVETAGAQPPEMDAVRLAEAVRSEIDNAVLAVAPSPSSSISPSEVGSSGSDVVYLPRADDLRSYYRMADIFLSGSDSSASRQRTLEAMACGTPVLDLDMPDAELAVSAARLLYDDEAYGDAVRQSLATAARHSSEDFAQKWGSVIATACGWLPVRLTPKTKIDHAESSEPAPTASSRGSDDQATESLSVDLLGIEIEQLRNMASVTLRDYEVRSPTPYFGPIIAWVRRNLTSHLRKPYIDPILDEQEAFNMRAVSALEELAKRLADHEPTVSPPPTFLGDSQALQLIDQIDRLLDTLATDEDSSERVGLIRTAVAQVRELLRVAPNEADSGPQTNP